MKSTYLTNLCRILTIVGMVIALQACKKYIPENRDSLGSEVDYTTKEFNPILGIKNIYENAAYVGTNTSQPLQFALVNVRTTKGEIPTELMDKFPVKIWKKEYSGEEKSLAEIESKRKVEYRPMLEIGKNSGDIIFWDSGNSNIVKTIPDSGYVFDVEIQNNGGRKYVRNMKLKPYKEMPYTPSIYNAITGVALNSFVYPNRMRNLYGERDPIFNVRVYFRKDVDNKAPGNSLTFSFVDSLNNYIDPMLFNQTDWDNLVHGFDRKLVDKKMVYQVAYPMPLISKRTRYTTQDGKLANVSFRYSRIGFGGFRQESEIGLEYAIFEEGHWEIQIRFGNETPKFEDEK